MNKYKVFAVMIILVV